MVVVRAGGAAAPADSKAPQRFLKKSELTPCKKNQDSAELFEEAGRLFGFLAKSHTSYKLHEGAVEKLTVMLKKLEPKAAKTTELLKEIGKGKDS